MAEKRRKRIMLGFDRKIAPQEIQELKNLARLCRGDIIKMTTIAGSGHPGGSMSSVDIYLTLYSFANITPNSSDDPDRDRIVISHGHTSPGLYACLARLGFINLAELLMGFRKIHSPFEGHIERHIPGVEWTTGNLGQGLSAGCGFALAAKLKNSNYHTYVVMSDAEQAKGQVGEARRFARKYNLNDLTLLVDFNRFQISGRTDDVMPVNIRDNYLADGWKVLEVSGHDFDEIHQAVRTALQDLNNPYVIICKTIMGKGVSFMENTEKYPGQSLSQAKYHGQALNREECSRALKELNIPDDIEELKMKKNPGKPTVTARKDVALPALNTGKPKTYNDPTDPRSVFGNVLEEIAKNNLKNQMAVFDCDLTESVHTIKFARINPDNFFEAGVSEHSTATISGALSINGIVTIWADFGVFAIDEAYNQMRLNDINNTNLKVIATHLGYNVGPDGKTHHCIDYIGLLKNLYGFKLLIPADPNHTDHIVRYTLKQPRNFVIGLGRTKIPIIKKSDGTVFYDGSYQLNYGKIDLLRAGSDCAIFTMGAVTGQAIITHDILKNSGINASVYCVSAPLHLEKEKIAEAAKTKLIISYEDHNINSGLGSVIAQIIAEDNLNARFIKVGIRQYGGSDEAEVLYKNYSLDAESLAALIKNNIIAT